ncbi:hypothetical protein EZV62_021976 [Acer yangbiense]|uniref:RRM domain-containing protein n=1 Tax=Acer yangbiense TaxID=1000413 RepID=A0A5C7H796_9ROSI|nr:hypothetical protein EZV62_021976 [Acer yangbiense]
MSHFGKSGPPDIRDTYSLLVLNITFRTSADDLFPLFDKYGKVVDVFIPRNRRTGESRGFAFVRYKYADEAQKAVEKLDVIRGRYQKLLQKLLQRREAGREAAALVQDPKDVHYTDPVGSAILQLYLFSSEKAFFLHAIDEALLAIKRYRDEYRDKDYRKRSRSRSRDRHDRDKYRGKERDHRHRGMSRSASPDSHKYHGRDRYDEEQRSRSRSGGSASPARHSSSSKRSLSPHRTPNRGESPDRHNRNENSPVLKSVSLRDQPSVSGSPSPHRSRADVRMMEQHSMWWQFVWTDGLSVFASIREWTYLELCLLKNEMLNARFDHCGHLSRLVLSELRS